jgi:hypothetical protein
MMQIDYLFFFFFLISAAALPRPRPRRLSPSRPASSNLAHDLKKKT